MKNFIALLVIPLLLLSTQSVSAESMLPRQAHIIFGEDVFLGNTANEIGRVEFVVTRVNNYGELSLSFEGDNSRNPVIIKNLSDLNAWYLRNKIIQLSNAKLQTTFSSVVCMMMPPRSAMEPNNGLKVMTDIGPKTYYSSGVERLLLSNSACWSHEHTSPEAEFAAQEAVEVRAVLRALRNEILKELK